MRLVLCIKQLPFGLKKKTRICFVIFYLEFVSNIVYNILIILVCSFIMCTIFFYLNKIGIENKLFRYKNRNSKFQVRSGTNSKCKNDKQNINLITFFILLLIFYIMAYCKNFIMCLGFYTFGNPGLHTLHTYVCFQCLVF